MNGTATRIATLSTAVLWLAATGGCGGAESGPEEQIRAWVEAMHVSAEAKNRSEIIDRISPAYADARGNSRDDINNMLRFYFLRQDTIALLPRIEDIVIIAGTAAEVSLSVGMAGTNDSALGISADAYSFELELESNDGDWRLISARWGELGQQLR